MTDDTPTSMPAPEGPTLAHIASRVFNRPLLLEPEKAEIVLDVLAGRLSIERPSTGSSTPDASRFFGRHTREDGSFRANRIHNGVAIIPVVGSLVNRGAWIGANSGLVSYEGLAAQMRDARDDPDAHSVILDIESFGGEAGGVFGLAELIREVRTTKPVIAVINDAAASGGYAIASAASEIVVSQTSIVGHIGVLLLHIDRSGEMEMKGRNPTYIHAGAHKVDGHSFAALADDVRARLQAEVDQLYDQFVASVAAGRGDRISADDVRATEARVFVGQAAIEAGLADRIASFDAVLSDLSNGPRGAATQRSGFAMSKPNNEASAPQAENAGISEADHEAALDRARAEGAAAERERIAGILGHEAAEGREAQARAIALETDMTADQAAKVLAASPKASAGVAAIEERAAGMAEFGNAPQQSAGASADAIWERAVKQANCA